MSIHSFLIAVDRQQLVNEAGETTEHLISMFHRMVDAGVNPVYVFDGKLPTFKSGEMTKLFQRKREVHKDLNEFRAGMVPYSPGHA